MAAVNLYRAMSFSTHMRRSVFRRLGTLTDLENVPAPAHPSSKPGKVALRSPPSNTLRGGADPVPRAQFMMASNRPKAASSSSSSSPRRRFPSEDSSTGGHQHLVAQLQAHDARKPKNGATHQGFLVPRNHDADHFASGRSSPRLNKSEALGLHRQPPGVLQQPCHRVLSAAFQALESPSEDCCSPLQVEGHHLQEPRRPALLCTASSRVGPLEVRARGPRISMKPSASARGCPEAETLATVTLRPSDRST